MKKYGDRGRWGAVEMATRTSAPQTAATTEPYRPNPISYLKGDFRSVDGYNTFRVRNVRLSEKFFQDREHAPLVLWDDAVVRIQTFSNAGMARDIETIEFIGNLDEDLIARYGTAARYGIIKVTSKQAVRQSDSVKTIYDRNNHPLRYLKGDFRSVDGRNTYKVRKLKLQNLSGKKRSELPLVVADGRIVDITALTDELAGKILKIRILSAEEAVKAGYQGARATNNGVIEAWTRNRDADITLQIKVPRQTMRSQMTIRQDTAAHDGKEMVMMYTSGNQQEMSITLTGDPETGVYSVDYGGDSIVAKPVQMESASVLVNRANETETETLEGEPDTIQFKVVSSSQAEVKADSLVVDGMNLGQLLLLLDGKEVTAPFIKSLDADQIDSIRVVKNQAMIDRYGERAANGVVFVSLKKESPAKEK